MSGAMRYDFGAIDGARADIAATSGNINGKLADLKSYLAPLVAEWEGSAAEAYQANQAKWDKSINELNQTLEAIGRAVGAGNEDMAATNTRAAQSWN
ncbi:WXG100 family type VII secretion target [Rhodococcus triatomae]